MNFLEPNETPYDLRWTMFGIPVRVHPLFWLIAALMGNALLQQGVNYLLAWIGCVFVSVLVHELGHVLAGSAFGSHGHIVLYSFGGLAIGSNRLRERWRRIAVSLAGPFAGFAFLAAIFGIAMVVNPSLGKWIAANSLSHIGVTYRLDPESLLAIRELNSHRPVFLAAVSFMVFINVFWGIINLLPVFPLDGGQVSREAFEAVSPRRGFANALLLSIVIAVAIAIQALLARAGIRFLPIDVGGIYTAVLFGLLAYQNYVLYQQTRSNRFYSDDRW